MFNALSNQNWLVFIKSEGTMGIIDSVKQWAVSTLSDKGSDFLSTFIQQELASGHQNKLTKLVNELIDKNGSVGGVQNLLSKFDSVQLGHLVQSWLSKGSNQPISTEQTKTVFGQQWINRIAEKLDMDPTLLVQMIALLLPALISKISQAKSASSQSTSTAAQGAQATEHYNINVKDLLTSLLK